MSEEPQKPASGQKLDRLKRRIYALALTFAGVAAMVGFFLESDAGVPLWAEIVFGPVIAMMTMLVTFSLNARAIPLREMEKIGFALAAVGLFARCGVVLFLTPPEMPLTTLIPDFAPWMASVFIFAFVALRTRLAVPASIGAYLLLIALAVGYYVSRGPERFTRSDINLLVQVFVVSNAFTIAMLYFLSRTKEELTKERTERTLMSKLAHTDELTGLANRRFILQSLQRAIDRSARDHTRVAVVMFDLDHFKVINDTHGHAMGDAVLRRAAEIARTQLRTSDEIGRYGGEEFLAVAYGGELDAAALLAERLRTAFEHDVRPGQPAFTASFGVAVHQAGEPITSVLARADAALYAAKARGRNRVVRDDQVGGEGAA